VKHRVLTGVVLNALLIGFLAVTINGLEVKLKEAESKPAVIQYVDSCNINELTYRF